MALEVGNQTRKSPPRLKKPIGGWKSGVKVSTETWEAVDGSRVVHENLHLDQGGRHGWRMDVKESMEMWEAGEISLDERNLAI